MAKLFLLLAILLGIAVGVYLVGHPAIFNSNASGQSDVQFFDSRNNQITGPINSNNFSINVMVNYNLNLHHSTPSPTLNPGSSSKPSIYPSYFRISADATGLDTATNITFIPNKVIPIQYLVHSLQPGVNNFYVRFYFDDGHTENALPNFPTSLRYNGQTPGILWDQYVLNAAEHILGCNSIAACVDFCKLSSNSQRCTTFINRYSKEIDYPAISSIPGPTPRSSANPRSSSPPIPLPSSTSPQAPRAIGYIGCSNSLESVDGYHLVLRGPGQMWPSYMTSGAVISEWANPNGPRWALYDQMVQIFGQPQKVWIELCENLELGTATYQNVQAMISNLRKHTPNATYYISAINTYNPVDLCSFMQYPNGVGTPGQGEIDTQTWRDQAVKDGLALRGPDLGPLVVSDVGADHCHLSTQGETLIGNELNTFFQTH